MLVTQNSGALKKFRRTPWRFQQTMEIPQGFEAHQKFASAIIAALGEFQEATVTIDEIVFGAECLTALCPADAHPSLTKDVSISVGREDACALLSAAFTDGPDFVFLPSPKPFVCYADHDQWITFYSNTKSQLNHIIKPLASCGYELVKDWQREL